MPDRRRERVIASSALILTTALGSLVLLLVTDLRCGAAAVGGPSSRSAYCRALGLPGGSGPIGLPLAAAFAAPLMCALVGVALSRGDSRRMSRTLVICGALLAAGCVALMLAHSTSIGPD